MATDSLFRRAELIHLKLIETVTAAYPRNGWSECFARTIEKELALKPWCHTSTFEIPNWKEGVKSNFAADVRGNDVMEPFD
jgi:cyanamide hydratase